MAKEISREYRDDLGAVVVRIQTDGGPIETHTLYVLAPGGCPACGHQPIVPGPACDLEAEIEARKQEADARRAAIVVAFERLGRK